MYHDMVLINHNTKQIHSFRRLTGSCNINKDGFHNFNIIPCKDDAEVIMEVKRYLKISKPDYDPCDHCFKSEKIR